MSDLNVLFSQIKAILDDELNLDMDEWKSDVVNNLIQTSIRIWLTGYDMDCELKQQQWIPVSERFSSSHWHFQRNDDGTIVMFGRGGFITLKEDSDRIAEIMAFMLADDMLGDSDKWPLPQPPTAEDKENE